MRKLIAKLEEKEFLMQTKKDDSALEDVVLASLPRPLIVAGIPAFNEEKTIARIIIESQKFADEVIVCDDGSSDLTAEIAERLGAIVVRHGRNSGYGASIRSLFKLAIELNADALVTLDADGQHNPKEIPVIIKPITENRAAIVIGSRFVDTRGAAEMPMYRRIGAKLITKLVNGSSKDGISDAQSGFRAYSREALERLSVVEEGMGASIEILLNASKEGLKICEVPCSCKYENGDISTSTENPLTHGLSVVASIIRLVAEEKPLRLLGLPGVICLIAGVFFGVWMLQIYAVEHHVVTNIALASIAFVLIAFFLLSTSITLYAISRVAKRINGKAK